jgi:iron complex transport system substrate-binding protein
VKIQNLLFLFLALIVTSCSINVDPTHAPASAAAPTFIPLTLKDGLGRQVTIGAHPGRILSIAPSTTEILYAIGAGQLLIGRDQFSDYPEQAKALPSIGTLDKINNERIVAMKPDLVLTGNITSAEQVKSLEGQRLTVFVVPNPESLDELYDGLNLVGQITGREKEAAALVVNLKQRVEAVNAKVSGVKTRPTVFYEIDGSDPLKPWTAGPGSFIETMIVQAGGQNAGHGLKKAWAQISSEEIVRVQPDIILLGDANYGITAESVGRRSGWGQLPAVKNNAIHIFDDNLVSRPGPRLVEGLETLAKLIHPELFK